MDVGGGRVREGVWRVCIGSELRRDIPGRRPRQLTQHKLQATLATLTYAQGGERFSVPENVYVLGMMNTADKSLSLVDYALRRRFAFASLRPAFNSDGFEAYLASAGVEADLIRRIIEKMSALNETIRGDDKELGPGFEIGHSYFVPPEDQDAIDEEWYSRVIRTQIQPLLAEYWFDQPKKAIDLVEELLA